MSYTDKKFPPNLASLGWSDHLTRQIIWKRPQNISPRLVYIRVATIESHSSIPMAQTNFILDNLC